MASEAMQMSITVKTGRHQQMGDLQSVMYRVSSRSFPNRQVVQKTGRRNCYYPLPLEVRIHMASM